MARLGLSGYFLDRPFSGSGQYTTALLQELLSLWDGEIVVFCLTSQAQQEAHRFVATQDGKRTAGLRPVLLNNLFRGNWGKLWFEQVAFPWACRQHAVDILHVPYFAPPLWSPCPRVVTIHDIIPLVMPEPGAPFSVRMYNAFISRVTAQVESIITDSEHTRQDVLRVLGPPAERVRVVYLACGHQFRPVTDTNTLERVWLKYGLRREFVLYLGGLEERKNVATLIRAFAQVPPPWELAIAGGSYSHRNPALETLRRLAEEWNLRERVHFLGWVDEGDKPALYSLCGLFVFPSLYEGFGIPPLEAMACGAPVLCSSASSLPEVVGAGAMLFDPTNQNELTRLMAHLLTHPAERDALRERGLRQAVSFSWKRTAKETTAVYQGVLDSYTRVRP